MSAAAFSISGVSAIGFLGHCILARDEFVDPVDHSDVEVISLGHCGGQPRQVATIAATDRSLARSYARHIRPIEPSPTG